MCTLGLYLLLNFTIRFVIPTETPKSLSEWNECTRLLVRTINVSSIHSMTTIFGDYGTAK